MSTEARRSAADQPDNASEREAVDWAVRLGPIEVDWPQALGYFGAVALAVAFDAIAPPVGLFIAAVPFLKLLDTRDAPRPTHIVAAVLEGAAKPVGGDTERILRLRTAEQSGNSPSGGTARSRRASTTRASQQAGEASG